MRPLGNRLGLVETAVLATVTWVLTVLLAQWMGRLNYRGPAEVLLRRLTYRVLASDHARRAERCSHQRAGLVAIGAIAVTARSLAPDLARGAMLLLIALANAHLYLYGRPVGVRGYPIPESTAERLVVLVQMTFVDGRAYPMFAFLFGYGIVQLWRGGTP